MSLRRDGEFIAEIVERSSVAPNFTFSAAGSGARVIDVSVRLRNGSGWSACFAGPDPGIRAVTALLATPHPFGLCVIERGAAFLGDVRDPSGFSVIEHAEPVVEVLDVTAAAGLLLLISPWSVVAIDDNGLRWVSGRLSVYGLRIDEVRAGLIRLTADPDDVEPSILTIDATTGRRV